MFAALYFSEGAPIGFLWWALPTRLRAAGVDVGSIAALAGLLALPWAFKFFWAPAVDVLRSPRWTLRSWIVSSQVLMGLSLLPLLVLDLRADLSLVVAVCLAHAFAAATQDVAVDALAIGSIPAAERGALTAWMQGGMLLGRSLFGGGALLLEGAIGGSAVILLMIAAIWSSLAFLLWSGEEGAAVERRGGGLRDFTEALRSAFSVRRTWQGLGFALLSGAGFELAGAVAGPFLLDHGVSKTSVGWFLSLPVVAAMLAGAVAGGRLSDRLGRRRAAALALSLTCAVVLSVAAADAAGAGPRALIALFTALYAAIGVFTAASYALFMELTDARLGATQFSAYMGATNACESWSAVLGGRLIAASGYPAAFAAMALLSLSALPLLRGGASSSDATLPSNSR